MKWILNETITCHKEYSLVVNSTTNRTVHLDANGLGQEDTFKCSIGACDKSE